MRNIILVLTFLSFGCSEDEAPPQTQSQALVSAPEVILESDAWGSFDIGPTGLATASSLHLGWNFEANVAGLVRLSPTPSNDKTSTWNYSIRSNLKRGDQIIPTPAAQIVRRDTKGNAVFEHGIFDQIFKNGDVGIEWSFRIHERLGEGRQPLVVDFHAPDMQHRAQGDEVLVYRADQYWFKWNTFKAWDANQRPLEVELKTSESGFALHVSDEAATYPITVDPVATTPFWSVDPPNVEAGMRLGWSLAMGDFSGNGHMDILVGQQRFSSDAITEFQEGRVLLFEGSASGPAATALWAEESNSASALFGQSLARIGRLDLDAVEDFAVGASGLGVGGGIRVFIGGNPPTLLQQIDGDAGDALGTAMTSFGDFNCDGVPDLLVSTSGFADGIGRVWLYAGSLLGFLTPPVVLDGTGVENFGSGIAFSRTRGATIPQCDDVIIGAAISNASFSQGGRIIWYPGSIAGLGSPVTFNGLGSTHHMGRSVARAGDLNGDGFEDVVVGAPLATGTLSQEGAIYVYFGSALGLNPTPVLRFGGAAGGQMGSVVSRAGDVNGDGFADILVGSRSYSNPETNEGRALVFNGIPTGLSTLPGWTFESNEATAFFGHALAGGGDFNSDGHDDIVVGGFGPANNGMVRAFLGGADCLIGTETFVVVGTPNPTNPCEVCNPSVSPTGYSPVPDNTTCDDGNACTVNDVCTAGACGGTVLDCDDGNSCTTDSCDSATGCVNAVEPDGTTCDDLLFCTINNVCAAGVCVGDPRDCSGTPGECFEPGVCNEVLDQCDAPAPSSTTTACGGGTCLEAGLCDGAGACVGAGPLDCSALDTQCSAGSCNATTGLCEAINVTNGTACDDGSVCTTNDTCNAGVCGGAPLDCDDGNSCTANSCDPVLGCVASNIADNAPCNDGSLCTSGDVCVAGTCTGSPVVCNDGNGCTVDSCDPALGCVATAEPAGTSCDDGLFCTVGTQCDGAGACVGTPRDCSSAAATCFDGVACDETANLCIPANPTAAGVVCGGDACLQAGSCDGAGTCSGESTVDCSNLDSECQVGSCDPSTGLCVATSRPDGTVCDDQDACTENNACEAGVCTGDMVICQDDGNECTAIRCDVTQGCVTENVVFGTVCSATFCSADSTGVYSRICDGSGTCSEDTTTLIDCAPYLCTTTSGEEICQTTCAEDLDCQNGFVCEDNACVEPSQGDPDPDMGDMGESDMGESDMGESDMGESDMGEPDMGEPDMAPVDMDLPDTSVEITGTLEGSGCACSATSGPDHSWLLLLGFAALRRRRSKQARV